MADFLNICKIWEAKNVCIYLIIKNCTRNFQNTDIFETDLLTFCKLTLSAMKQVFLIQKLKELFRVKVNIALLQHMVYSIHSHIFYILEASSKRPHYFSLIGRKPNKILQFKWKKTYGTKIQTKIRFKIHAEGE